MTDKAKLWRNAHWIVLIVAVLMMRAFVPQGYMAAQDGAGGIAISVCNSEADWVIPMKDGAGSQHDEEGDQPSKACAFAAAHDNVTPPDGNPRLALPQLAQAAYNAVRQRALSPTTPGKLPPARAPPAIV